MKRIKKVFRKDGGLAPAFCERVRHEVEVWHLMGRSLAVAHLYGAFEDDQHVYMVQELCTGELSWLLCSRMPVQAPGMLTNCDGITGTAGVYDVVAC